MRVRGRDRLSKKRRDKVREREENREIIEGREQDKKREI